MTHALIPLSVALAAGCAAPADRPPPKGGADTAADTGPAPDTGGPPRAPDWTAVEATLDAAWADAPPEIPGLGLLIVDAAGATLFAGTRGALDLGARLPVASASKLISALVTQRAIDTGLLDPAATTADVLGWDGPEGAVDLPALHGFVSGLDPEPGCVLRPQITLAACVDEIRAAGLQHSPGAVFHYGSGHQHVAGRMVEVATGLPWNDAFSALLAAPLGLTDPGLRYVTLPQRDLGTTNPLVAGGLWATPAEYARLVLPLAAAGRVDGAPFLSPAAVDALFANTHPTATVGYAPDAVLPYDFRYGYGAWLLCPGPVPTCPVIASPGAYGFTPWIDRDRGLVALLVMDSGTPGGATWAVPWSEVLRPQVAAALDAAAD